VILESTNDIQVDYKGTTDLVTNIDREVESIIIEKINSHFPDHTILAEESGLNQKAPDYLWVIDPLDGTTNFVHGYPSFGVSIGLLIKGIPSLGVVMELPSKNLYSAYKGNGAYKNGKPINVSKNSNITKCLLATGFPYDHGERWKANMRLFEFFTDETQGVRRLGAASVDLCHLACGYIDGFWELDLKPWDTAAGIVIVSESGGKISRMDGNKYSIYDNQILASNGIIHDDLSSKILSITNTFNL